MRRLRAMLLSVGIVAVLAAPLGAQTLLDRVVARVNGTTVLLSDVRAAVAVGLVEGPAESDDAVEQMVQRALLVEEVNRFPPPEPTAEAIAAELARMRTRAGSFDEVERQIGRASWRERV